MQGTSTSFDEILARRMSRRSVLRAAGLAAAVSMVPAGRLMAQASAPDAVMKQSTALSTLTFKEVPRGMDSRHHLPEGYKAQVLLRWGDKIVPDALAFDPLEQSAEAQAKQFGYNNDFTAYFPLDPLNPSSHGLLCVNHEYTNPELMFPGGRYKESLTEEEHHIEMAAHGVTIVEIRTKNGQWHVVPGQYNRRLTATTPMKLTGPAAGHPRLRTTADPDGGKVLGTLGNCAGGQTPWGTYLTCEENIDVYFNLNEYDGEELPNHKNMAIGKTLYHRWDLIDPRFDVKAEPNEPNRFGWVVQIDPMEPRSLPIKHTALGRFKHESATCVLTTDKRVAVYSGDDEHFQHIYRYISEYPYDPGLRAHNLSLFDHGTLAAAKFNEDGTVSWLPLIFGNGPLTAENGFNSQADVMIETRRAAQLLGATPMDRPEDIEVNPTTGCIYIALTKNPERDTTDAVNRRAPNPMGYVVEIMPPKTKGIPDHLADHYEWDIFLEGGDPQAEGSEKGDYPGAVSTNGWLACPDNFALDPKGRLWITTDGQEDAIKSADTLYATDTHGPGRGMTKAFMRGPMGCELTGPSFTPDGKTLFISVQHPASGFGCSTYDQPYNRWPDFEDDMPPRPAVLAIMKEDGGVVGG